MLEFDCSNGRCSNTRQVNTLRREQLETLVFGAIGTAIGAYIVKEGVQAIGKALVETMNASKTEGSPSVTNSSYGFGSLDYCSTFHTNCKKSLCAQSSKACNKSCETATTACFGKDKRT